MPASTIHPAARNINLRFLRLSSIILLAAAVTPQALAVPINLTLTGYVTANGGGTGPTPNTVAFSWAVSVDSNSITNPSPGMYQVPAITNTLTLVGDKTTGIENVTVYLNTSTGTVTFGNIPGGGIGLTSSSLTSWNLASPIGPFNGPNVVVTGTITESSGNAITLSGVASPGNNPSPNFQAALASPTITNVENAASNNPQGLPNAPIAQGAIFIVQGSDLGPANISIASSAFQSTTLSDTSVAVTMNGTSVNVPLYYTSAGQVAALLPSNTPTGTGTIAVTYAGSTSAPAPITVVANNLGIFTINSSGEGPGIVTFSDYSLVSDAKASNCGGPNTTCGAANPGDTLILWATGLGPVSGNDVAGAGLGVNMPNIPLKLWLGGIQAPISYQGRSGCCVGEDQIVFTVPDNVPTGCAVPLLAQINNQVSNGVLMPVANGSRNCTATNPALAEENVAQTVLSGQLGGFADITLEPGGTGNPDAARLQFGEIASYNAGTQPFFVSLLDDLAPGTCGVYNNLLSITSLAATGGNADAGSSFMITGPNGTLTEPAGQSQLDSNGTFLVPGAFTISGAGGANIGAFKVNVTIPATPNLTTPNPSNPPSSITRSNGLTVSWTGGSANAVIQITVYGATDSTGLTGAQVVCEVPSTAGTFTIPPYVLSALPANNFGAFNFSPFTPEVPITGTGLIFGEIQTSLPGAGFGVTLN
jgi:uncharacterized protein (TIGR03437 family)